MVLSAALGRAVPVFNEERRLIGPRHRAAVGETNHARARGQRKTCVRAGGGAEQELAELLAGGVLVPGGCAEIEQPGRRQFPALMMEHTAGIDWYMRRVQH